MLTRHRIIELLCKIQDRLQNEPELSENLLDQIEADLVDLEDKIAADAKNNSKNSIIHIWSDGACTGNPGPGGWGTIVSIDSEKMEFSGGSPGTTNNIMELTGALEGIRQTPTGTTIELTSDSQYLVKGMTEWIHGWKKRGWKKSDGKPVLNSKIWKELDKEASKRTIKWHWVKGHAGHPENERCDELAREAIPRP